MACSMSFALGSVLAATVSSIGAGFESNVAGLQFGVIVVSVVNALLM